MFYYQAHTSSVPVGLVQTVSDFIVMSVETGLVLMLILFRLSQTWPDLLPQGYMHRHFLIPLTDGKVTEFGSSNQEASASVGKNNRVVLVFLKSLDVLCFDRWVFSESQKLLSWLVSHELTAYFSAFSDLTWPVTLRLHA